MSKTLRMTGPEWDDVQEHIKITGDDSLSEALEVIEDEIDFDSDIVQEVTLLDEEARKIVFIADELGIDIYEP